MKNCILFLTALLLSTSLSLSQISVSDENGNPLTNGGSYHLSTEIDFELGFLIKNSSTSSINYTIVAENWQGEIGVCAIGVCVPLNGTPPKQIGTTGVLAGGSSTTSIDTHFQIGNTLNIGDYVTIKVSELENASNSFTFTFDTETPSSVFSQNSNYSVYPNPVSSYLVFSGLEKSSLRIVDISGKTILSTEILSSEEYISLEYLENGLYFYTIFDKNSKSKSGKFVVSK